MYWWRWFRIDVVSIGKNKKQKRVAVALPAFECICFCKPYFLLEAVPIFPMYISKETFLIFVMKKCSCSQFLGTFCVVLLATIGFVYICIPIAFTWVTYHALRSTQFPMLTGSVLKPPQYQCMVCGYLMFRSAVQYMDYITSRPKCLMGADIFF